MKSYKRIAKQMAQLERAMCPAEDGAIDILEFLMPSEASWENAFMEAESQCRRERMHVVKAPAKRAGRRTVRTVRRP
jgi:hypothetical protein